MISCSLHVFVANYSLGEEDTGVGIHIRPWVYNISRSQKGLYSLLALPASRRMLGTTL